MISANTWMLEVWKRPYLRGLSVNTIRAIQADALSATLIHDAPWIKQTIKELQNEIEKGNPVGQTREQRNS